jgi:hypothetical protein
MEKLRIFWIGTTVMARQITLAVVGFKRAEPRDDLSCAHSRASGNLD